MPQTKQRWLDFGLGLPEGASDSLLLRALHDDWNPALSEKSVATRMSELRVLTHPTVRRHLATIRRKVGRLAAAGTARYKHLFMAACQRVRRRGRP